MHFTRARTATFSRAEHMLNFFDYRAIFNTLILTLNEALPARHYCHRQQLTRWLVIIYWGLNSYAYFAISRLFPLNAGHIEGHMMQESILRSTSIYYSILPANARHGRAWCVTNILSASLYSHYSQPSLVYVTADIFSWLVVAMLANTQ